MAVQYIHVRRDPLNIPIFAIDGRRDRTIQRGYMREWQQYTTGRFRNIPIEGDHYFVSSSFQQASARASGTPLGVPNQLSCLTIIPLRFAGHRHCRPGVHRLQGPHAGRSHGRGTLLGGRPGPGAPCYNTRAFQCPCAGAPGVRGGFWLRAAGAGGGTAVHPRGVDGCASG